MKKTLIVLFAAAFSGIIIQGCSHSSSSSSSYSLKATVNGVAFATTNCIAQQSGTILSIDGGNFTGTSYTAVYPVLIIDIENYTGTGTYQFPGSAITPSGASLDSSASSNSVAALYGSVTITATSPNILGTFSFTGIDSTKVTSGTFTAKAP